MMNLKWKINPFLGKRCHKEHLSCIDSSNDCTFWNSHLKVVSQKYNVHRILASVTLLRAVKIQMKSVRRCNRISIALTHSKNLVTEVYSSEVRLKKIEIIWSIFYIIIEEESIVTPYSWEIQYPNGWWLWTKLPVTEELFLKFHVATH